MFISSAICLIVVCGVSADQSSLYPACCDLKGMRFLEIDSLEADLASRLSP
jgi:hypothetical protein